MRPSADCCAFDPEVRNDDETETGTAIARACVWEAGGGTGSGAALCDDLRSSLSRESRLRPFVRSLSRSLSFGRSLEEEACPIPRLFLLSRWRRSLSLSFDFLSLSRSSCALCSTKTYSPSCSLALSTFAYSPLSRSRSRSLAFPFSLGRLTVTVTRLDPKSLVEGFWLRSTLLPFKDARQVRSRPHPPTTSRGISGRGPASENDKRERLSRLSCASPADTSLSVIALRSFVPSLCLRLRSRSRSRSDPDRARDRPARRGATRPS